MTSARNSPLPSVPNWQVEWHASIDSTMTRATELAASGAPAGTVVVADFQRQGRGTHGREWLAPAGTCLMFTVIARPNIVPAKLEPLPALIAERLADALARETGLTVDVKQPNDIMVSGKKLCGILCSSRVIGERVEWVLCGVGLNTHMDLLQLPLASATSLRCERVDPVPEHADLLTPLLKALDWLVAGEAGGCAEYADKPILSCIGK